MFDQIAKSRYGGLGLLVFAVGAAAAWYSSESWAGLIPVALLVVGLLLRRAVIGGIRLAGRDEYFADADSLCRCRARHGRDEPHQDPAESASALHRDRLSACAPAADSTGSRERPR